jgi:DNA-binding CsgD family transcriptional regulator
MKDYTKAKKAFMDCLILCEDNGIEFGQMMSFINLGNVSFLIKEYVQADIYLNKALDLAKKMDLPAEKSIIYNKKSKLYFEKGAYREAFQMQELYQALEDSLTNENIKREMLTPKEKFESEKKSNEINNLTEEKLRNQLIIAFLGVAVLILVIGLLWYRLKQQLTAKEKLQNEHQREMLRAQLDLKDKEMTAQLVHLYNFQNDTAAANTKLMKLIEEETNLPEQKKKQIKANLKRGQFLELKEDFENRITENNTDFYSILLKLYPNLTPAELKICAYLRLGVSSKEIAQLTNRSVRTVETLRTDIRKKLGLSPKDNLISYLIALV